LFDRLDLNVLPVWLVAIAVVLWLLPKILREFAAFIPPLSERMKATQKRQDAVLHHEMDSETARESQQVNLQDRMLTILENSLEEMWKDRNQTHDRLDQVIRAIDDLRRAQNHATDVLQVHTATVSKLADEVEGFDKVGAQIASVGAYLTGGGRE
jgi:chromosome segregation ATPase